MDGVFKYILAVTAIGLTIDLPPQSVYAAEIDFVGLDHYAINVTDLNRSAGWYERVLGFRILHKWTTTWMIGRGNIKVGLFLRPDAKPPVDTDKEVLIQHVAFLVDCDKFTKTQEELARRGVQIEGPEDTGPAYSIFFTDPDGHLLEVTTYHDTAPVVSPSAHAPSVASRASHAR